MAYRPSLDGLRALAMYVIVLFHTKTPWAEGAFIAVNLFFVLSGYLVTTVILAEIERKGRLDLGRFYARRVRRLLPAALVAIVGISFIFVMVEPVVRRVSVIGDGQASLLYYANWRFIAQSTDYFATDVDKSPFLHFWTLSIEEQFYVAFPLIFILLVRMGRRWVLGGFTALMLLSLGAQFFWAARDPMHAYFGTEARAYQLLAGVVLALVMAWWPFRLSVRGSRVVALGGLATFLVLCFSWIPLSQAMRGVIGTVACVALIAGLMAAEDQPLGRLLSRRAPVYLGQISYSTYLWHWPAILVMQKILDVGPVVMALLAGVLATGLAAASAELLEMPIRKAKVLDPHRWRIVVSGVTASVLAALVAVPAVLAWDRKPDLIAGDQTRQTNAAVAPDAEDTPTEAPRDVDWSDVEQDKGRQQWCTPDDPQRCVVHEGKGPHVLLVGDSHAAMIADMWRELARKHDFTLSMNVVLGCPWQENLRNVQSSPDRQSDCDAARVGWYDEVLPELDPDIVVVAGFPREDEKRWGNKIEQRDGSNDDLRRATLKATRQTLRDIDRVVDRMLLIQTIVTPNTFDPNECMTTTEDIRECAAPVPTGTTAVDAFLLTEATQDDDFYEVDLNPAFCPSAPLCQPVVDDAVVWRDREHLTPVYAKSRADEVWKLVRRSGVLDGTRLAP